MKHSCKGCAGPKDRGSLAKPANRTAPRQAGTSAVIPQKSHQTFTLGPGGR